MPLPADSDALLDVLAPEDRSLLPAVAVTRACDTGGASGQWVKPLAELYAIAEERLLDEAAARASASPAVSG